MNLVKILATGNFSSRRDLARLWPPAEFRFPPRFSARFWPPGISLPAENPAGNINPAGQNLAGIPARFPAGSRQDPGPFFTRVQKGFCFTLMMKIM